MTTCIDRLVHFPFGLVDCLGCVGSYWQGNDNSSSRQSKMHMKGLGGSKDCIWEREREREITPSSIKCIRQWSMMFLFIIAMITTDYGIGEYALKLSMITVRIQQSTSMRASIISSATSSFTSSSKSHQNRRARRHRRPCRDVKSRPRSRIITEAPIAQ